MVWINRVLVVMVILSAIYIYRKLCPGQREYFSQKSPFILRQDNEVYDPFYLEYYDDLHATESYRDDDFLFIMEHTNPNLQKSVFLDIGCGTGLLLHALEDNGYTAFGVDKSKAMIDACGDRLKYTEAYCNDVLLDPMLYENNTFSHITCTHFTIYEMEKKETLLRHCFNWLHCGGYLIIHLVDPDTYKKVLPSMYDVNDDPFSMVTKTNLDYNNYTYRGEFKSGYLFTETFTDKLTENVRQNQRRLYMESKKNILDMAITCGFVIQRETSYNKKIKDPHQYMVALVKPMCGDI